MRNKLILVAGAAILALAVVAVSMFNNVSPVSAQQIIERASAAQFAAAAAPGIWHYRIEEYLNPGAVDGNETGKTMMIDIYEDLSRDLSRSVTLDAAGKVIQVFANDNSFSYFGPQAVDGSSTAPLTIHRTPEQPDPRKLQPQRSDDQADLPKSLFEQFRDNPHVELAGRETWADGSPVYILIDRSYQTQKSQNDKTFTGTMKMVFNANTYALLESETTVVRAGKEIVLERVRFLLDENLPSGTVVTWDLSDLEGVTFVDDPVVAQTDAQPMVGISMQELARHPQTYALKTIPEGYRVEIVAAPNQPADQPYTYEITYTNQAGESFDLQAVGVLEAGFVETSFYDGSYKTASGLVLNFSSSQPEGSGAGTSAMLTTPEGVSFLVICSMSREQVQALAEELVRLK